MTDAGQPTRLKRASVALSWLGLALATLLVIFVLVPMGASGSMSATAPATSSTPDDSTEITSPETWVLSSTRVTSTPAEDAPDTTGPEFDRGRARAPRSTPLIIQVPLDGPTTQPPSTSPTPRTAVSWPQDSGTTTSSRAPAPTTAPTTDEPTCTEPAPDPSSGPSDDGDTDPASTDDESAQADAGSPGSGNDGDDSGSDPDTCED